MSFEMHPLPPDFPEKEKLIVIRWAFAYITLSVAFIILGLVLVVSNKASILIFLCGAASWFCTNRAGKNIEAYRRYQRYEGE